MFSTSHQALYCIEVIFDVGEVLEILESIGGKPEV